ncbi:MAG: hypothetical protein HQL08_14475, partial [Nitrospirae bacterium]|nr:hypothetical protein [Nitrospirota bacterium]
MIRRSGPLCCRISSSDSAKIPFISGRFCAIVCCVLFALLLQVVAARVACAYDITVVKSDNIKFYNDALEGFRNSCNCSINVIDLSRYNGSNVVHDAVDSSPDAVVAIGSRAYKAVRSLTSVPVFAMLVYPFDPVKESNVWWVSTDINPGRYLAATAEVLPHADRLGLIFNPSLSKAYAGEFARAARERGLQLMLKEVATAKDVPAALASLSGKIDLLVMIPDTSVATDDSMAAMVSFSYQNAVPIMTFSRK